VLVLDANILIRGVLGSRVLLLLRRYEGQLEFFAPDTAFREAREHLPGILTKRKVPTTPAIDSLDLLSKVVRTVAFETYGIAEAPARRRSPSWRTGQC